MSLPPPPVPIQRPRQVTRTPLTISYVFDLIRRFMVRTFQRTEQIVAGREQDDNGIVGRAIGHARRDRSSHSHTVGQVGTAAVVAGEQGLGLLYRTRAPCTVAFAMLVIIQFSESYPRHRSNIIITPIFGILCSTICFALYF